MDAKLIEKLRQKYTKNPPEGMTPSLVKNMTDSDLLDMHYFLTEDDDLDDDEFEEDENSYSDALDLEGATRQIELPKRKAKKEEDDFSLDFINLDE